MAAGYWHLFRYDPRKKAAGQNPFSLDSKEPTGSYQDFIKNETRYTSLELMFPERAKELFAMAENKAKKKYEMLKKKVEFYKPEE